MFWNHLGMLSLVSIVVAVLAMAMFQSTSSACLVDRECGLGYFCETTRYECVQCLKCEDMKREPSSSSGCIKSVKDCGPCIKGLVEDRLDDLNCVLPKGDSDSSGDNSTMWIVIGIFLVLLMIAAAVLLTHLWRTRTNKFTTSGQNDTILPVIGYPAAPTAPDSPPPYRPNPSMDLYQPPEEAGLPLIKTDLPNSPQRYLVSEDPQKANVFNPPAYVRYGDHNDPPPEVNDVNDNYVVNQDETTRECLWTPGPSNNSNASSSQAVEGPSQPSPPPAETADLSAALAVARNTDLVQPPAKRIKQREQNDMESIDEEPHDSGDESRSSQRNIVNQTIQVNIQVNQKLL